MDTIMIAIKPEWVQKILSGEKTIEVRKTAPKEVPFKVYIYCTYGRGKGASALYFDAYGNVSRKANGVKWINGKVVAEFICNEVETIECSSDAHKKYSKASCLSSDEFISYCNGQDLKAIHIADLKIYDKPKELGEFRKVDCKNPKCGYSYCCKSYCGSYETCKLRTITRPPQSWQYIQEEV